MVAESGHLMLEDFLVLSQITPNIAPITAPISGTPKALNAASSCELEIGEVNSEKAIIPKNMQVYNGSPMLVGNNNA